MTHEDNCPVILDAVRTPVARAYGALAGIDAAGLLVPLIGRLLERCGMPAEEIDDIIIGNAAGGGGNIARLAGLEAGLPLAVPGVTVDRQCGSGLEAVIQACRMVEAGAGRVYLAGGVESLSTAPWRVEKPARPGDMPRFFARARFAPAAVGDPEMGIAAENVAAQFAISRERQDAFALQSHKRALVAQARGDFSQEIVPLMTAQGVFSVDDCPRKSASMATFARLKPAFSPDGTVTAGNSCPLNDGAALVLVTSVARARAMGAADGLCFVDAACAGVDPNIAGIGPVASTRKLMQSLPALNLDTVDYIEFNEAFASQVLASLDRLAIAPGRVNRQGGAIALGHPFGASGAFLVTRLFSQMVRSAGKKTASTGIALVGIGGGLGLTALFRRMSRAR